MFSFHKPKTYRSIGGCCICRAKSSSSRFTDSVKYEKEFERCFRIRERREGDICNACVLLVKRWKKLPSGTNRHWNHVVDARSGPGTKSTLKLKSRSPSKYKYKSRTKKVHHFPVHNSSIAGFSEISFDHSEDFHRMPNQSPTPSDEDSEGDDNISSVQKHVSKKRPTQFSSFLDLSYWKKTQVCCGIIFKGLNGELLVDPQFLRPCVPCRTKKLDGKLPIQRSQSTDTESNASSHSNADTESCATDLCNDDCSLSLLPCEESMLGKFASREVAMEC